MVKKQLGKRLIQMIIILFGISFLSFLLTYMAPGDPVRAMFAVTGNIPAEEVLDEMRQEMGLDRPFLVQYGSWLSKCVRGDFGTSYSQGKPVSQLLAGRVAPTLYLSLLSLAMMLAIAIPVGVISALHQNRFWDYFCGAEPFSVFRCQTSGSVCCCCIS